MFKRLNLYLPSLTQCWVIVFLLIIVGGTIIGTIINMACMSLGIDMMDINPLISYILPIIPAFAYILVVKSGNTIPVPIEKSDFGKVPPLLALPVLALSMIAISYLTEPLSSWLPMPESIKQIFEKMLSNSTWAFVATVIAAPIIEEVLLRGVMERGLLHHTTPVKAIMWSAFFFAVIHLNPWQAIGAFIAGIFIGWIYWRTHSLIACIFVHATNNGVAYIIQLLFPNLPPESTYKDLTDLYSPYLYYVVFVIFVILLAVILFYLNRQLPKNCFKRTLSI